jgi:hypothetical protein
MAFNIETGEQYTIRRKVFKLFGAGFHIYDPAGKVVGYCEQKAFKLREDFRVYTDDKKTTEFFRINTQKILDFSATYFVWLPDGTKLGSLRRKGLTSTFIRDEWLMFDAADKEIALLHEESTWMGLLRRTVEAASLLFPQKFILTRNSDNVPLVQYRQHFNPFIYRLGVKELVDDPRLDGRLILAAGCLIGAIEGRQS